MKITVLKESGFCGGVTRTLLILNKTIKENEGKQIYLLGPIVHNQLVNDHYKELGVKFIDNIALDDLEDGSIVVVSAHGKSDKELEKLSRFKVVDTTCPYVIKNKQLVKRNEGNNIIFIGKKYHSETRAICGDNSDIFIVENENELKGLSSNSFGIVFNQTTFNINKLEKIQSIIKDQMPYFEIINTICPSSKNLQETLSMKDDKYNTCIIVGDKTSSNSNSLYEMSPYNPTYFISSAKDIDNLKFRRFDNILIVGSASTPKDELTKVKERIKELYKDYL